MRKNIWIDGYEANVLNRLGSGQVGFNLLKNLYLLDNDSEFTICLPNFPQADLPKERDNWHYKILHPRKFWTYVTLPFTLFRNPNIDVFFSPTQYIPRFSRVKKVATIFDLAYLQYPSMFTKTDYWKLKNWSEFSIKKSAHIITISEYSKQDIIKNYQIKPEKITVAYPGYDSDTYNKEVKADQKLLDEYMLDNYIIYIGTLQPRKNLVKLIEAVSKIKDLKLVIAGKTNEAGRKGWMYQDILDAPKKYGIENRVIFTGFLEKEKVAKLLFSAKAFILPSLYEGFGISVVESMAMGTPVIVSNVSSLPEVVGEAGLLIDPNSTDSIVDGINKLFSDKALSEKLSRLGIKQAAKFSWQKMAEVVLSILKRED